jgi:hypothetical protein
VLASDASPAFVEPVSRELPDVDARRIRLPDDPVPDADAVVGSATCSTTCRTPVPSGAP